MIAIACDETPVSKLMQRDMPAVIEHAVQDLAKRGVSIAMGSAGKKEDITVFLRGLEYTQFIERFDQTILAMENPTARQELIDWMHRSHEQES
jgi:hypothetical protein